MGKQFNKDDSFNARISIDHKLPMLKDLAKNLTRPVGGWIATIRVGLGMSKQDLAEQVNSKTARITSLERKEVAGKISLNDLSEMAEILGCDLVYGFVPRQELEKTVKAQAYKKATNSYQRTQQTMTLEGQAVLPDVLEKMIVRKAQQLEDSADLWKD